MRKGTRSTTVFDCGPFLQLEQGVGNTDAVADQKLLQLLSFLLSGTEDSSEFHQTKLPKLQQQGRQVQQAVQVDSLQAVLNYRGAQESGYKSISLQPLLLHSSGVINHPGKGGCHGLTSCCYGKMKVFHIV